MSGTGTPGPASARKLAELTGYRRMWTASTVSAFGTYVTTLALQIIAAVSLGATATELGVLNAARFVPYLVIGLFVGVLVDRYRRVPILIGADLGRAMVLCAIPALYAAGILTMISLIIIVAVFGTLSLIFDAADQSFLPRLVPPHLLTAANARLEQSDAVAQTTGPLLAGALVKTAGAPLAILVDAISYAASALIISRIRVNEAAAPLARRDSVWAELRGGLRWVYRHPTLAPLAWTGHIWFLSHSMLGTVYVVYALRPPAAGGLGLDEVALGATFACAGIGAVAGTSLATRAGQRFGPGRTMIGAYLLMPLAWLPAVAALPPPAAPVAAPINGSNGAMVVLCAVQLIFWLGCGLESANSMGYRQAITPDRLQARMNTTIRSLNRGAVVVGAPLGGIIADAAGYRQAIWVGIGGLALSGLVLTSSPLRHVERHSAQPR